MTKKQRIVRYVRNVSIAAIALIFLIAGIGIGYTWYVGQFTQTTVTQLVEDEAPKDYRPAQPVVPGDNVPQGVSVQTITSAVIPGSNASIIVKTNPRSTCTIKVEYNKIPSTDSGLTEKDSGEYGSVTWAWTVEDTVPVGKWPVTVSCKRTNSPDKWAVVSGDLVVKKTLN